MDRGIRCACPLILRMCAGQMCVCSGCRQRTCNIPYCCCHSMHHRACIADECSLQLTNQKLLDHHRHPQPPEEQRSCDQGACYIHRELSALPSNNNLATPAARQANQTAHDMAVAAQPEVDALCMSLKHLHDFVTGRNYEASILGVCHVIRARALQCDADFRYQQAWPCLVHLCRFQQGSEEQR